MAIDKKLIDQLLVEHELPEFFGAVLFQVRALSDAAFRRLIRQVVGFYVNRLFNDHWGETISISRHNVLSIRMVCNGLSRGEAKKAWKPFLDWVGGSQGDFIIPEEPTIASAPARKWWDVEWWRENHHDVFVSDSRPGANPNNVWWSGDGGQVAWTIYGFESLWLPESLLRDNLQERLASALFTGSRHQSIQLHFNKGLAGAPQEAVNLARDTAMNLRALDAFALAIVADAGGGYPGIKGHEPDITAARKSREQVHLCMRELRAIAPSGGAYVSEGNFLIRTGRTPTGASIISGWRRLRQSTIRVDCSSYTTVSDPKNGVRMDSRSFEGLKGNLPVVITLASEASATASYDNYPIARVNDHVVRISVMTQPYHWHSHPNSDETFLVIEGGFVIELEQGEINLLPGQMVTVSRGMRHCTRPLGKRSVTLTFEAANAETTASEPRGGDVHRG